MAFAWKGSANGGTLLLGSGLAGRGFAASGTPISTTLASTVTYDGVTYTLDRAMPVGQFVTGKPFVVSSSAFFVNSSSEPSSNASGVWVNGMMKDPLCTTAQGFHERIGENVVTSASLQYTHALNVEPGATGSPVAIAEGEETTLVHAISRTTALDWQNIAKYIPLTILAEAPLVGAYCPAPSGLTKKIKTRSDVNMSALWSLDFGGALPSYATAAAKIPADLGHYGANGQSLRRFRLDNALGTTDANYSAQIAGPYAEYLWLLHDDSVSAADKQAIIDFAVEAALQLEALMDRGASPTSAGVTVGGVSGGAGQHGATHPWLYAGAFLVGDSAILTQAQALNSNMNANGYWATSAVVGSAAPGKSGVNAQTFFTEQVGLPFIIPDEWGSNTDTRYGTIAGSISNKETLAVAMLKDGPGGITGTTAMLKGGAFDNTNTAAAHIAYMDRARRMSPWVVGTDVGSTWRAAYDVFRASMGVSTFTSQPDQLPPEDWFSAAEGAFSYDLSAYDYSGGLTVTQIDLRKSLDAVQWVESLDVASSGSLSGLLRGALHYVGGRLVNAIGNGLWSLNYSYEGGAARGTVTPTGTATAAAPTFTTTPQIHAKIHPNWVETEGNWKAVSGTLAADEVILSCGVGYSSGYPAPTYTYQWKRDGVDISGATSKEYTRVAADAGTVLTCFITSTNASGSDTATTAGVTCPAIPTLPATSLIDTDFGWEAVIDYETQIAAAESSAVNGTFAHDPTWFKEDLLEEATFDFGAIYVEKDGSSPEFIIPFKNPTVAGRTYNVTAQICSEATRGDCTFDIIDPDGNSVLTTGGHLIADGSDDAPWRLLDITDTITGVSAGVTLRAKCRVGTSTGFGFGGWPALTILRVKE